MNNEIINNDKLLSDLDLLIDSAITEVSENINSQPEDHNIFINDPNIVEIRVPEYKHTGYPCLLITLNLGICLEAPIATDFEWGNKIIKERIEYYFRSLYIPHSVAPELYLPEKYLPYDAVEAAFNLDNGKKAEKEIEKYLSARTDPLIIAKDSLYQNYSAKSWFLKFWMIAEKNKYKFLKGGQ